MSNASSFTPLFPNPTIVPVKNPDWLHRLESCPSTNTWALDHLSDLEHGAVVLTQQQTNGRGQHGRIWYAPPGVLTLSVVLDRLPAAQLSGFSLIAGLAVIYAIEDLIPSLRNQLRLKWTNDVLLHDRKLAGILCEGVTSRTQDGTKLVVGIGLNYCADFSAIESMGYPISLHEVTAVPDQGLLIDRLRYYLLQTAGLLQSSERSPTQPILVSLLPALRDRDALLGQSVTIELSDNRVTGEAIGIDDQGCLRLRLLDGTIRSFNAGHILVAR